MQDVLIELYYMKFTLYFVYLGLVGFKILCLSFFSGLVLEKINKKGVLFDYPIKFMYFLYSRMGNNIWEVLKSFQKFFLDFDTVTWFSKRIDRFCKKIIYLSFNYYWWYSKSSLKIHSSTFYNINHSFMILECWRVYSNFN